MLLKQEITEGLEALCIKLAQRWASVKGPKLTSVLIGDVPERLSE